MRRLVSFKISLTFLIIPLAFPSYAEDQHQIEISASVITEGTWNPQNEKTNWANRADIGVTMALWKGAYSELALVANQNTRLSHGKSWTVLDDPQSFSNIQTDEEIPLSPAVLGITQQITPRCKAFFGVRNMNGDYFITPLTGLFINSSYGIYPTIADNWNIGNYPVASLCLHLEGNLSDRITIKNSTYNGMASRHWDEVFRFRPGKDGWIDVCEIGYTAQEHDNCVTGEYRLGVTYGRTAQLQEEGDDNGEFARLHTNWSVYGLAEHPLISGLHPLGLLLQAGYAPKSKSTTWLYWATGLVCTHLLKTGDAAGITLNRSLYCDGERETCMELTYRFSIIAHLCLQPALQCFRITGESHTVALMRATFEW